MIKLDISKTILITYFYPDRPVENYKETTSAKQLNRVGGGGGEKACGCVFRGGMCGRGRLPLDADDDTEVG